MFRIKILLKFICMIRRRKQCKYAINITSIERRFESSGQSESRLLAKLNTKILAKAGPNIISRKIDTFGCISFILRGILLSHEFYI